MFFAASMAALARPRKQGEFDHQNSVSPDAALEIVASRMQEENAALRPAADEAHIQSFPHYKEFDASR